MMEHIHLNSSRTSRHKFRFLYVLPCFCIFAFIFQVYHSQVRHADGSSEHHTPGRQLLEKTAKNSLIPECVAPSMDSFPGDFFTQKQRKQGGVVIHFIIVLYLCAMIAVTCDDYFIPSLDIISRRMNLSSDVAGATFMAIGTSAPELFSAVIGSFVTEDDIGVGTIVGSAVFNILAITGITGLVLWNRDLKLDWYPITRDIIVYGLTVAALIIVISNNIVTWYESLILLVMFGLYIVVMYYNTTIERFSKGQLRKWQQFWNKRTEKTPLLDPPRFNAEVSRTPQVSVVRDSFSVDISTMAASKSTDERKMRTQHEMALSEFSAEDEASLCSPPRKTAWKFVWWAIMWPASLLFFLTIPNCKLKQCEKYYIVTFFSSVVWLGVLSYMSVWMVTIIGYTFGFPDTVSGLTILAAGTSIPELISSIIVVEEGRGNMAMGNLIGSNVFDILFCLGAPWFIKTLMQKEGYIVIASSAMTYTTTTLLSSVVGLFAIFLFSKWKLNRAVGVACLFLYAVFVILACMYEMNFFGDFNPPTCERNEL